MDKQLPGLFARGRGTQDIPWAAGRQVFPTWGHLGPSPEKRVLKEKASGGQVSQTFMRKGAGPPSQAVCRIFISHQFFFIF